MAKVSIEHACGHTESHQLYGPGRDRERKAAWLETTLCYACYKEQQQLEREQASAAAAEQAVDAGLPELTGTEKQVAWAERIRADWISQNGYRRSPLERHYEILSSHSCDARDQFRAWREQSDHRQRWISELDAAEDSGDYESLLGWIRAITMDAAGRQTSAHWWIENRNYGLDSLYTDEDRVLFYSLLRAKLEGGDAERAQAAAIEEQAQAAARRQLDQEMQATIDAEATLLAATPVSPLTARIDVNGKMITVRFAERNDQFRMLVRTAGFSWSSGQSCWTQYASEEDASALAAVTGRALLGAGFNILVREQSLRERILHSDASLPSTRVIYTLTSGPHCGQFALRWGHNDDLYHRACRIPGARWSKGVMHAPADAFAEVEDFAQIHGFTLLDSAIGLIEAMRNQRAAALTVEVEAPELPPDGARVALDETAAVTIPEDLRDEN